MFGGVYGGARRRAREDGEKPFWIFVFGPDVGADGAAAGGHECGLAGRDQEGV